MSSQEPKHNYVYQPYGAETDSHRGDKLFGVSGPQLANATIKGLSRDEAEAIARLLDIQHGYTRLFTLQAITARQATRSYYHDAATNDINWLHERLVDAIKLLRQVRSDHIFVEQVNAFLERTPDE